MCPRNTHGHCGSIGSARRNNDAAGLRPTTGSHCGELCLSPCKGVTLPFNVASQDLTLDARPWTLRGLIDLPRMREQCETRAGLHFSSSSTTNGNFSSLEYSLLSGRIRVGIANSGSSGRGILTVNGGPEGLQKAHIHIGPQRLIGFLLGDISPKAMMHLVALST